MEMTERHTKHFVEQKAFRRVLKLAATMRGLTICDYVLSTVCAAINTDVGPLIELGLAEPATFIPTPQRKAARYKSDKLPTGTARTPKRPVSSVDCVCPMDSTHKAWRKRDGSIWCGRCRRRYLPMESSQVGD